MADKTLGIKVTEEVYDKAKAIIDMSGLTAKDWLEKAVALYELNSLKDGISGDYSNDLAELEVHTTRIYALISNMVARSTYLKDHAVKEVSDKLESKESIITELQEQNKSLKASISELEEQRKLANDQAQSLEDKLISMQNTLDNNQALINEYKEKNDTLSGLVTKYQGYAEENEALKIDFSKEKSSLIERATAAESKENSLQHELADAKKSLISEQKKYEDALQMSIERKDLEREKALVELERQKQAQMATLNEQHNEQIRALYNELADLRKTNEESRERYQAEIEVLKAQKDK